MNQSLGERIRSCRKQLRLTQSQLAGEELTKSMLSQIENNQAQPSMKTLLYLSQRLGKPVSYFIDVEGEECPLPEAIIYNEIHEINNLLRLHKTEDALEAAGRLSKAYPYNRMSRLYADVICKFGECLIASNRLDEGETLVQQAIVIYTAHGLQVDAAKANLELMGRYWHVFDYNGCLGIIEKSYEIYKKSPGVDYAFEIQVLYYYAIMYSALGDDSATLKMLDRAADVSRKHEIYYKADEINKVYAFLYLLSGDYPRFHKHLEKVEHYARFTENAHSLASVELMHSLYENTIGNPKKALAHISAATDYFKRKGPYYYIQSAVSYYLMEQYETALSYIMQTDYSNKEGHYHSFDHLMLHSGKVYEGLILSKLGKSKEALEAMLTGIEKMEAFRPGYFHVFAYKSLGEVYSLTGDYEMAYKALKKAEEYQAAGLSTGSRIANDP